MLSQDGSDPESVRLPDETPCSGEESCVSVPPEDCRSTRTATDQAVSFRESFRLFPALAIAGRTESKAISLTAILSRFSRTSSCPLLEKLESAWGKRKECRESALGTGESSNSGKGLCFLPDLILFAAVSLLYLTQLGSYPLMEPDEGRYAETAREMAVSGGDWLIPHLNGVPRFQKPPVFYWAVAVPLKLFGNSEVAARLPVALSALGVLFLTYGISRRLFGKLAGQLSLIVLATAPLFAGMGRTTTPDMTMALSIIASLYCLVRARETGGIWRWLVFVFAGIGFLTKGPVSFLVPFSTAILWSIFLKRHGQPSIRLPWVRGVLVSLVIGLSWFVVCGLRYPELFDYFWTYELVDRVATAEHGRTRPFWFFIPIVLFGFLPWTWVFLNRKTLKKRPFTPNLALFTGWIVIPFIVLSASGSKLPSYVLPLFPGLAVMAGAMLARSMHGDSLEGQFPRYARMAAASCLIGLAFAPVAVDAYLEHVSPHPGNILWAIAILAGTIWWLAGNWRGAKPSSICGLAGLMALGMAALPGKLDGWNNLMHQQASTRPIAESIQQIEQESPKPVRVVSCGIRASGLMFYLGRNVEMVATEVDAPGSLKESALFQDVSTIVHPTTRRVARLEPNSEEEILVVTRTKTYEQEFAGPAWKSLKTAGDFVLLRRTNEPAKRRNREKKDKA